MHMQSESIITCKQLVSGYNSESESSIFIMDESDFNKLASIYLDDEYEYSVEQDGIQQITYDYNFNSLINNYPPENWQLEEVKEELEYYNNGDAIIYMMIQDEIFPVNINELHIKVG